jgi:hypothetical protein
MKKGVPEEDKLNKGNFNHKKMRTRNILYWVFTLPFVALMLLSAIVVIKPSFKFTAYTEDLGYPLYLFGYLAVAKILGVIAILVPVNPRIKEWAYAGFSFDLSGALYSLIAVGKPAIIWTPILLIYSLLSGSYIFYHKKLKSKQLWNRFLQELQNKS